jgi:NTP pyrophosphatase (non-canonical NTP hydrolase)
MEPNDWQGRVITFARRHGLLHDPATHALDLASEVGEVAKEVLLATEYGQQPPSFRPQVTDEIGDALYSLLILAQVCGVDAGEALNRTLKKYNRRLKTHGQAGSHQSTN